MTALIVFFMLGSCPAMGLTDYSTQLDYQGIQVAFRAGLISREDQVISSLKSCFGPQDEGRGSKSATGFRKGRDLTMLLKQAKDYYSTFSVEGRDFVDWLLMRPTSSTNIWPWDDHPYFYLPTSVQIFEPPILDYPNIGGKYKFWYVAGEPDNTHNTPTGFIYDVVDAFETSYATEVVTMGYTEPVPDTNDLPDNGGDGKIDVYLMNCGEYGVYGYTAPIEVDSSSSYASYMVIDNDYTDPDLYLGSIESVDAMRVTVAHEFHHAIQFAINSDTQAWIMEATSTWMESQVYPDIPDNLQYLNGAYGFFANPDVSLDDEFQWYNNWIWMEYKIGRAHV